MHEMLNEYQALWQTLKDVRDAKTQPVVLFNTMRNILEYYFSFSCKNEKLKEALESLATEHSDAGEYDSFTGPSTATRIRTVEIFSQPASSIRNAI
jgi:wobble nucleotide-excising tRNase